MTMSQHQAFNKTWNQQISQQRNQEKEKLTLKFILECGASVLGSWRSPSSSFHSRDGWYFFPLKVWKEGPLEDAIVNAKKNGGLEMGFKNGFLAKMVKNTKIWEDIEGDGRWMKEGWEAWESDFLERKWCNEGENASWWSVWIVTMEEERKAKRNGRRQGTLFYHLSCWVNSQKKI